jgi:hypothetical protein
MTDEPTNLAEALASEISRNTELLGFYREIHADIGAALIQQDLDRAIKAVGNGDVIEMLRIYEILKGNE